MSFASANDFDNFEPGFSGKKFEHDVRSDENSANNGSKKCVLTEPFNSVEKASLSYLQEFTDFQIS